MRDCRQEGGGVGAGKDDKAAPRVLQPDPVPTQATRPWPRPRAPRRCRHSRQRTSCPAAPRSAASSPTGPSTTASVTYPPSTPTPEAAAARHPPPSATDCLAHRCVSPPPRTGLSHSPDSLHTGCRSAAPSSGRCPEALARSAAVLVPDRVFPFSPRWLSITDLVYIECTGLVFHSPASFIFLVLQEKH